MPSILCKLLEGQIDLTEASKESMIWLGQTEQSVAKTVMANPVAAQQVNVALDAGKQALAIGEQWAGTFMSGELSNLAAEAGALVAKYAPRLIGAVAGGPMGAAAMTAIQAIGDVGVAAIQHAIATQLTTAPSAPVGQTVSPPAPPAPIMTGAPIAPPPPPPSLS